MFSYHAGYSCRSKVVLYYKEVPLFSSVIESVDKGRTSVVPPEFSIIDPYYIQDSFRYLMFEFVFKYWCGNYATEAREIFLRVIPLYKNYEEHIEFSEYVKNQGILPYLMGSESEKMQGKALERFQHTKIGVDKESGARETIAQRVKNTPQMVINFAKPENKCFQMITEELQKGKMLVDWLKDWRHSKD